MKIFKVGGSVRDTILRIASSDTDYIVFDTSQEELVEKYPGIKKVGNINPVYIYKGDQYTISDYDNIHEDLLSRDLTINAIAMDKDKNIIFHPNAKKDLQDRILRPVSQENFFKDPVRVFRAARFASYFPNFTVSSHLKEVMINTGKNGLTSNISPQRVGNELKKAFSSKAPEKFIELLKETDNLFPWFKEFDNSHQIPAGPVKYHGNNSVLDHTILSMKRVYGNPLLVWMAFCHDIGKTITKKDLLPKHHNHEVRGIKLAKKIGNRLKLPARFIKGGVIASKYHMKAGIYDRLRPSTRVKFLLEIYNKGFFREIFIIAKADKGICFFDEADKDLKKILNVKLPNDKKGLGEKSGDILFQMRCDSIRQGPKTQ